MRLIYSGLLYLLSPLVPLYLKKRGKKNPQYLLNWNERFGFRLNNSSGKAIVWFHAVSVGETRAMHKLIDLVHQQLPDYQILITNMTPTGRATAQSLYPYAIVHYVPYDLPHAVINFYQTFQPKFAVIMETEIWPNLIHYAAKFAIPIYLANARLSESSYNGYRRFKWLLLPILNKFNGIFCQDTKTQANFKQLGYRGQLEVVGNTKFDLIVDQEQLNTKVSQFKMLFGSRKIICFASTRNGEEQLILAKLKMSPQLLYLIIPRHPERFVEVEQLLVSQNIIYQKRSTNQPINPDTQVLIGDSLGEMLAYYAVCHFAIIGGSFSDCGGQNPIEAIYMQKPVLFGPSMFNFDQVANDAVTSGCAIQVDSVDGINVWINQLTQDQQLYAKYSYNCNGFIQLYQGASLKIFMSIQKHLQ